MTDWVRMWRHGVAVSGPAAAVFLVVAAACHDGGAERTDYPQWRGQNRDGAASAFAAPAEWPERLRLKWRVEVGEGYSSPLLVGDAVYSFSRLDGDEVMAALDADTGSERWRSGYPAPYEPASVTAVHGLGPKATPVYDEGRLFTLGVTGIVVAFDADSGKILWRTDAPEEPPYFSAAASPLTEVGLVIAHPGNYGPLTAFDAATGAVRWTAGAGGFFTSPIAADIGHTRQIVTMTSDSVIGVLPEDGSILWRYPWQGANGGPTPVVSEEVVIVSAHNEGVAAFQVTRLKDEWRTESIWSSTEVSMYLSSPVVLGDVLFGLSHRARGQYFALDVQTGETLWLGEPRRAQHTSFTKAGSTLFLLNDNAELLVAGAGRHGLEPIRQYVLSEGPTWSHPSISENRILVKDAQHVTLWALD